MDFWVDSLGEAQPIEQSRQLYQLQQLQEQLRRHSFDEPSYDHLECQWQLLQRQMTVSTEEFSPEIEQFFLPNTFDNDMEIHFDDEVDFQFEAPQMHNVSPFTQNIPKQPIQSHQNPYVGSEEGSNHRTYNEFPWLKMSNEDCSSTVCNDNTNTNESSKRKKCREMHCLVCAEFRPQSAWAKSKPRKWERSSLMEHALSLHHVQAVSKKQQQSSLRDQANDTVAHSLSVDVITTPRSEDILSPQHSIEASSVKVTATTHRRRGLTDLPFWLMIESNFCFSESQVSSGKDLSNTKKKYKLLKCSICAQFARSSQWAIARPRKCEVCVFAEHERSIAHRRSLEIFLTRQSNDFSAIENAVLG